MEKTSIGVIIVAHGKYGSSILRTAEEILGQQNDCVSISVDVAHQTEESVRRLNDAAERLNDGGGVIVLTDMFGGTPTNIALSLAKKYRAEVVTGVNLPMLLKVFENRETADLDALAAMAGDAGRRGIVVAGHILRNKQKGAEQEEKK